MKSVSKAFPPMMSPTARVSAPSRTAVTQHDVQVHPLHAQSYPSIGCAVCTTPVTQGEDQRAGRWRHLRNGGDGPQYCGLNFSDGGGI